VTQTWVANPATQWLVGESRCTVTISRCIVASRRDFEKTTRRLYRDSKTMHATTITVRSQGEEQTNHVFKCLSKVITFMSMLAYLKMASCHRENAKIPQLL
jgi:hypothetical protein